MSVTAAHFIHHLPSHSGLYSSSPHSRFPIRAVWRLVHGSEKLTQRRATIPRRQPHRAQIPGRGIPLISSPFRDQPVTRPWQYGHIASLGGLYTRPAACGIVSAQRPPLGGFEGHGIQGKIDEGHSIVLGLGAQVFSS